MADLVMGAVGDLVPKLCELLKEEYKLQTGVKKRISSLTKELEVAQAVLRKVGEVPWDQLDEQVQLWARELRESSYDMEDVVDTFLVRVQGPDSPEQEKSFVKRLKKFFKKTKAHRKISCDVKDIMSHLEELTERCGRYKAHDILVRPASSPIDPRLHAMYKKKQELVGMDKSSSELISKLQPLPQDGTSNQKMKIVSVVGVGGLGKTTLARAVYDELQGDFKCRAFVSVGRNPDLQKVLQMILIELDKEKYQRFNFAVLQDITQFINELRGFLHDNKRYFVVIDDIWEIPSWEAIKLAIGDDNNCGARIVITTRKQEVAEKAHEVYKLRPLAYDISRELFFARIGSHEGKLAYNKPDEVTIKFLKKCAGVPLAIITIASLLVGKPRDKWDELYRSIGFRSEDNDQAKNTMKIVSFSYYDLPAHLRTCLLYLGAFPEDSVIPKHSLVWMWVAEGFIAKKPGMGLFETGEGYFHDLINKSMLEAVKYYKDDSIVTDCRVHDMVLDFIRSISDKENFVSVVFGNEQDTLLEPRRLAHHGRTMAHGRDVLKMGKVRSFFAIGCGIETSDPFHGFTLLRVLVIDNNWKTTTKGSPLVFRSEHVRHLPHLRILSVMGAYVKRIPKEIGRLRFLQTVDMYQSTLEECPSPGCLPEQLVCLRLSSWEIEHSNDDITWLTRLTSLEELYLTISDSIEETAVTDFCKCLGHFNNLDHLTITRYNADVYISVLPSRLRHLAVDVPTWGGGQKLPSCVNASGLPNLSHLEITLKNLDTHDLKMLGMLPELRFLDLNLWSWGEACSAVVVIDKDASEVYFPRLRCCWLGNAMVSCYANEEDKSISFLVWCTKDTMPSISVNKSKRPSVGTTGGGASCNRLMPCLQVLDIDFGDVRLIPDDYVPGFEYGFPSLREIHILDDYRAGGMVNYKTWAVLRSSAEAHPNRPVLRARSL